MLDSIFHNNNHMFYGRYHRYVPLVVNTSRSFPHSRHITRFVTRLTRQIPLVEQELFTLLEHLSSPSVFSGVRVTRSLVLCVCFVDCCLSSCTFSFGHCIVCSSSKYGFWFDIFKLFLTSIVVILMLLQQYLYKVTPSKGHSSHQARF